MIIGVDPGGTTGWCLYDPTSNTVLEVGEVKERDFYGWLDGWPAYKANALALEDWIQRPGYRHEGAPPDFWLEQPVAKQVGAALYRAHQLNLIVSLQQPAVKPIGYKLAKLKYTPGKKGTHMQDAIAHAVYLSKHGIRK